MAATRNLRLAAIRGFTRYVEHHVPSALAQVGQIEAIPVKRCDQKLIRHFTMEEVRAILNATAPPTFFPCPLRGHSSRAKKLGCRRRSLTLRPRGCGPVGPVA